MTHRYRLPPWVRGAVATGWQTRRFDEETRMNSIVRDHLPATYFAEYQLLRNQLMELLADDDLAFRPGAGTASLGELCREIGEIEHAYVESFRTFRQDFDYRNPDPRLVGSVAALTAWYDELDRDLLAAVGELSEDDIANRQIERGGGFALPPATQLDIYREALLIFYAKVSIYLRLIGKPLPPQWHDWIG
jgi:hypothetical protein